MSFLGEKYEKQAINMFSWRTILFSNLNIVENAVPLRARTFINILLPSVIYILPPSVQALVFRFALPFFAEQSVTARHLWRFGPQRSAERSAGFSLQQPHPFDFYQANCPKRGIFQKKLQKHFVSSQKSYTFALAFPKNTRTSTLRKEFFDKIYINRK